MWLSCSLAVLVATRAAATQGGVVLVQPASNDSMSFWPEGARSVIAELALAGFEVTVQRIGPVTPAQLLGALRDQSTAPDALGAVAVVRNEASGMAYVWLRDASTALEIVEPTLDDSVAPSALALKVTEVFRRHSLELPAEVRSERPPPPPPRAASPLPVGLSLGAGAAWSADAGSLAPIMQLTATASLLHPLTLEIGAGASIVPMPIATPAGETRVGITWVGAHLLVEPWQANPLGLGMGPGLSSLWLVSSATPSPGFVGHDDGAHVGWLSFALRTSLQLDDAAFWLRLEPGMLLPQVRVRAGDEALVELGRPWVLATLGVSWWPMGSP